MGVAVRSAAMIRKDAKRQAEDARRDKALREARAARRTQLDALIAMAQDGLVWHVAITGSHAERKVEQRLLADGYIGFGPREIVSIGQRQRRKDVERPLFPRYCFFASHGPAGDVRGIKGLVAVLADGEGLYRAIPSGQVLALMRAEWQGVFNRCDRVGFRRPVKGDRMVIQSGPLKDWPVEVLAMDSATRVRCLVQMFGTEREVNVAVDNLANRS